MKLAYKDMLADDEVELFIRTYCYFHDGWRLERGTFPHKDISKRVPAWWLHTRERGSIVAVSLKAILKDILRTDRRVFRTWRSPAEMRIWFDLNKVASV